ncbi:hypothetical protein JAO29_13440 [Edaphobacter sp. HDX4]|uniref:hypothetical protein n=1 Tax=Edaphobacter sp. HDX4 TaxID=2794064 RepID=UPI002FE6A47F
MTPKLLVASQNLGSLPRGSRHLADERLEVVKPDHTIALATEYRLRIHLQGPAVTGIATSQWQYLGDKRLTYHLNDSNHVQNVLTDDQGPYISVIPRALGKSELRILVMFSDGGFADRRVEFDVQPGQRQPAKLIVGTQGEPNRNAGTIAAVLNDNPDSPRVKRSQVLELSTTYPDLTGRFEIKPEFASFSVRSSKLAPVLRIEPSTGRVIPLDTGHAIVTTNFQGVTNRTCIMVGREGAMHAERPGCRDLLEDGEKIDH